MRRHPDIHIDAKAQYYLNKLYSAHNLPRLAPQSVTTRSSTSSLNDPSIGQSSILGTSEWFCQSIRNSVSINATISLLHQAQQVQLADDSVYEAAFSMCIQREEFANAHVVFDMWVRAEPVCGVYPRLAAGFALLHSEGAKRQNLHAPLISRIAEYVTSLATYQPVLLTESVWTLVVTELCRADRSILAANLLSEALNKCTAVSEVPTDVLSALFESLQQAQSTLLDTTPALSAFERDLQAALYGEAALNVIKAITVGLSSKRDLLLTLATHHFNAALEMLGRTKLYGQVRDLFHIMRGDEGNETSAAILCGTESLVEPVYLPATGGSTNGHYKPSTFTVAEIVRCARASGELQLALGALVWGMDHLVYLPPGVISDALSFMYRSVFRKVSFLFFFCLLSLH